MGKHEAADELSRAIEWLREVEASAAELVEVGDLLFGPGSLLILSCCHGTSCTCA